MSTVTIIVEGRDGASNILRTVEKELHQLGGAAQAESSRTGGFFKGLAATAGGFLAANVIGGIGRQFAEFTRGAIQESRDAAHGLAQTEAAIKSTGGAAGVTAQQIVDMSGSLSKLSLFTDDAIQKDANLLLTFTNIKNAAGEGNDVFTQATKVSLDLAQAMGTDAAGGAIQLGKALNDPEKGITALTRVGVTFTDQQRAQIKTMQASGDVMGAQKVILAELNKEFGGSAEAAMKADGGFHLFQQRLSDVQQTIGDALQPAMQKIMGFMAGPFLDAVEKLGGGIARWISDTAVPAFGDFLTVLGDLGQYFGIVVDDGDVLNDFLSHLPGWMQPIVKTGGEVVKVMQGIAGAMKDAAAGLVSGDFSSLKIDAAAIFGEGGATVITDALQDIRQGWGLARDALITFKDAISGNWINDAAANIQPIHRAVGDFGLMAHEVFTWLKETGLPGLAADFQASMPANKQFVDDLTTALNNLKGQSHDTTEGVKSDINSLFDPNIGPAKFLNDMTSAKGTFNTEFHEMVVLAGQDWQVFWGQVASIGASIGGVLTAIGGNLAWFGGQVAATLKLAGQDWQVFWGQLSAIAGNIGGVLSTVGGSFVTLGSNISATVKLAGSDVETAWGNIIAKAGVLASTIKGDATLAWSILYNAAQTANTNVVNAITGIENAVATMAATISTKIDEAVGFFAGLPGRVTGAVGDLSGTLVGIGASLVQGLINGINSKFEAVRSALGSLTKMLPSWKGPPEVDKNLLAPSGRMIIQGLIDGFGDMTPAVRDKLKDITAIISSAADAISKSTAAFPLLKSFKAPSLASIAAFTDSTKQVVSALGTVAQAFKDKWLEQAGKFLDAASKGVGIISSGVDGLTKLRTFHAPSIATINSFADTVQVLIAALGTAAAAFKDAWLTHASSFLDTASKGLGILGAGVDGLTKLITFKAPSIAAVNSFADTTLVLVQALGTAAQAFKDAWLTHAGSFEDTAGKGLALLGNGVEGLMKLADFKAPSIAAINAFGDTVTLLVQQLGTVAQVFKDAWLQKASQFADTAAKGIGLIGTALDGFVKLATYTGTPEESLRLFARDLDRVVVLMTQLATRFGVDGPAAAAVFGTAVGQIIAPLDDAVTTFTSINKYKGVLPAAVQLLGNDIAGVVGFLGIIAQQANTVGVAAATAFSTATGAIFDALKTALDVLGSLAKYKGVAPSQIQLLVDDMLEVVKMTGTLAYQAGAAASGALDWQNHLIDYATRIKAGVDSIASLNGLTATATIHAQTRIVYGNGVSSASGGSSGSVGGSGGSSGGGIAFQGRASGGPVSAGRPYVVGERSPELFVPSQNGTIYPGVPTGRDTTARLPASELAPLVMAMKEIMRDVMTKHAYDIVQALYDTKTAESMDYSIAQVMAQ